MSDETPGEPDDDGAPKRRGAAKKKNTIGAVVVASMLVLALVTGLSIVFLYRHLNSNLTVSGAFDDVDDRPELAEGDALNVLLMGDDTRSCEGCDIDNEAGGGGSDTTILLHLSGDRKRAYGISIPRDSLVTRPDCGPDNEIPGGVDEKWNKAYALGGEACVVEQFEQITGIGVNDFVVVNFAGFQDMVNAVDGVNVCVPQDIIDPAHGINIKAGRDRELRGDEALDYVRVRYAVGNKSDLGRIKRQQTFIASMINKVVSAGTLTRPDRLVRFTNAATKSLTVSPGLDNLSELGKLALTVQGIGLDNIQFITVPWEYERPSYDVLWTKDANRLWRKILRDKPLTAGLSEGAISAEKPPTTVSTQTPSQTSSPRPTPSDTPTESATPTPTPTVGPSEEEVEAARENGLCA
ncbi:LCP family protein [Nocardioides sp. 616]|uniref:LCP family protein n=1 Tax=Nocardioides sp. 616 TaxID=2268090 RepID=UPI001F067296|nr:LCP family protein [Nocardioides sp. 616]